MIKIEKKNGDVFSLKNKIFKISWVFEPTGLTEQDKKCYVYNNFIKNSNGNKLILKDKWKIYIKNKIQNEEIHI